MLTLPISYTHARWSQQLPAHLDGPQTLVLAFAAPQVAEQPAPLLALQAAFPQSVLLGCSTAGEIHGRQVADDSVSVAVVRFEHTTLRHAGTPITDAADSRAAGQRLAAQLQGPDLRAVFVLSDGLFVNGTPLVDELTKALGQHVLITGGLAGDGSRFARTWVLHDGKPQTRWVGAVGLYGRRLRVGNGCGGGWSDFGPERRITRSEGNVLFELDGKPALSLYKSYLGDLGSGLPGTALLFPLAVKREGTGQEPLVRTVLAIDEAQQSLTFAGDLPQGGVARLMRSNTDRLIGSAGMAGAQARAGVTGRQQALVVSVSCVGRRLVLGQRAEEEAETIVDNMPTDAAHVGFYSYGEISPATAGGMSELHNQTMTVTVLAED